MFTSKNLQETLEKAQEVLAEESREKKHAFAGANDESSSINFGYLTGIAYEKKTLLRVIPTMTFIYTFSYWQIFWHSI